MGRNFLDGKNSAINRDYFGKSFWRGDDFSVFMSVGIADQRSGLGRQV
jgi:hypothetical protein